MKAKGAVRRPDLSGPLHGYLGKFRQKGIPVTGHNPGLGRALTALAGQPGAVATVSTPPRRARKLARALKPGVANVLSRLRRPSVL